MMWYCRSKALIMRVYTIIVAAIDVYAPHNPVASSSTTHTDTELTTLSAEALAKTTGPHASGPSTAGLNSAFDTAPVHAHRLASSNSSSISNTAALSSQDTTSQTAPIYPPNTPYLSSSRSTPPPSPIRNVPPRVQTQQAIDPESLIPQPTPRRLVMSQRIGAQVSIYHSNIRTQLSNTHTYIHTLLSDHRDYMRSYMTPRNIAVTAVTFLMCFGTLWDAFINK